MGRSGEGLDSSRKWRVLWLSEEESGVASTPQALATSSSPGQKGPVRRLWCWLESVHGHKSAPMACTVPWYPLSCITPGASLSYSPTMASHLISRGRWKHQGPVPLPIRRKTSSHLLSMWTEVALMKKLTWLLVLRKVPLISCSHPSRPKPRVALIMCQAGI